MLKQMDTLGQESGNVVYYKGTEDETYVRTGFLIKKNIEQNVVIY